MSGNKKRPGRTDDASGLAERLREARVHRGMLLREVGAPFGITPQSVGGWERGETRPDPDRLPELADLLGVNLDWLMRGQGARDATHPRRGAYPGRSVEFRDVIEEGGVHRLAPSARREVSVWPAGPRAFAVYAWDDALAPVIPRGARLIIDPDPVLRRGSAVMVRLIESDDILLRAFEVETGARGSFVRLRAANDYDTSFEWPGKLAEVSDQFELLGVVSEVCIERPVTL